MSDLIDRQELLRQIDIDAGDEPGYYGDTWKFIDTIKSLPSATDTNVGIKLGTNLAEVGTDCISRQSAIDALDVLCQEHRYRIPGKVETYSQYNEAWQDALGRAEGVIGNLPSAQAYTIHSDGRLWVTVDDIDKVNAVVVDEKKSKFCKQFYMDAQPESKRGKWIGDGSELGCQCPQCGKTLDEYINCGTEYMTLTEIPKFCPNCGTEMGG